MGQAPLGGVVRHVVSLKNAKASASNADKGRKLCFAINFRDLEAGC